MRGVLFDIDGTLVDSNYLHVVAWARAFTDIGEPQDMADIHRLVGVGSDVLLERLLGRQDEAATEGHTKHYDALKPELRAFPGAVDLLRAVKHRDGVVVLATSASPEEVEALLEVIEGGDAIDEVTGAGDVEDAKPAPDIFGTALKKGGLRPEDAIVVGDTVWDVEAARKAGLDCVCLLTGGIGRRELEDAGAVAVYDSAAALLREIDASPLGKLLAG
jgi:HAD superfamily hydrolase (TIGR01509 family)